MTFAKVRALAFVAVLLVTAGVAVVVAIARDTQTGRPLTGDCPPDLVPANVEPPERSDRVKINVFNGTKIPGLAQKVAAEFKNRGFKVQKVDTAAGSNVYHEIAVIRYGPQAVGAGWLVSAYFLVDQAVMEFDLKRKGDVVDVIIGTRFQQLATKIEVNQSIAALGRPELPPGTCAA